MSMNSEARALYKACMQAAKTFKDYNFRSYTMRRVREEFRRNQHLQNKEDIEAAMQRGKDQLPLLNRQSQINAMYGQDNRLSAIEAWQIAKREAGVTADNDRAQ